MSKDLVVMAVVDEWVARICAAWRQSAEGIIETGKLLTESKIDVTHGETQAIYARLPFGERTAQRLMEISHDLRLVKPTTLSLLPPDVSTMLAYTKLDNDEFQLALDEGLNGSQVRQKIKLKKRDEKERVQIAALPEGKYRTILADPPWSFKVYSGAGKDRAAETHYPTKSLDEIKALPIGDLAADDCALFLWAVWPELPGALEVIKAWGFEYKTAAFVWVKQNKSSDGLFWGMGYWTRANTEPCLLATKGNPQRLNADVHQVIMSSVREHSRKPDETHERTERLVGGPYLELYARRERPGWKVWGNEIIKQEDEIEREIA